jgi:cytochrome c peroxidase
MKKNHINLDFFIPALGYIFIMSIIVSCSSVPKNSLLNENEHLGKLIFFDENLSEPSGQSCATCHTPERGFADKDLRMVSEGAVKGLFANRNAITSAYSAYVPALTYDEEADEFFGGLFWDGRANSLEEQAKMPFTNPLEMGNTDDNMVVDKVKKAKYYRLFKKIYGNLEDPDLIFDAIADAIAAYERSVEVNPFSSKYDAFLEGKYQFTDDEARGMDLFTNKGLGAECHVITPDPLANRILFTDHTYDNLGIPANPDNPFYTIPQVHNPDGRNAIDLGLGEIVNSNKENGKFRVPTLRNIELTAPYGHNGFFKTL